MNKKIELTQFELARKWAYEFHAEQMKQLPPQIRNNVDWDLVAADLTSEMGQPLTPDDSCLSPRYPTGTGTQPERANQLEASSSSERADSIKPELGSSDLDAKRVLQSMPKRSIEFILQHFMQDEERHFAEFKDAGHREAGDSMHVFVHLVEVSRWLIRKGRDDEFEYFGSCPQCRRNDGYRNIGRVHWYFCLIHRTKWWVGENLFSSWRAEDESDWKDNDSYLADFTEVQPLLTESEQ